MTMMVKIVEIQLPPVRQVQITLSEEEARLLRKVAMHDLSVPEEMNLSREQTTKVSQLLHGLNRALTSSGF